MKLLVLLIVSATLLLSEQTKEYVKPEFYSIGMLSEGYSFVCTNKEKWLQHEEDNKIVLQKLFYQDEETGKVLPHKCH